ncbi:MAG: hypothetical protein AAF497_16265, partial [Planctomycetota bacterium]
VGAPFVHGDANLDGVVDVGDFNVWNSNKFFARPAWCDADFNADGFVDVGDFNVWNSNKFQSSAGSLAVPEPCSVALGMIGFLLCLMRRSGSNID